MAKTICPFMSQPVAITGTYDQPGVETQYVDCKEGNCALWVRLYEREGSKVLGAKGYCSFAAIAQRSPDGYIDV